MQRLNNRPIARLGYFSADNRSRRWRPTDRDKNQLESPGLMCAERADETDRCVRWVDIPHYLLDDDRVTDRHLNFVENVC